MFTEAKGDPRFFDRGVDIGKLRASFSGPTKPERKHAPIRLTPDQEKVWKEIVETGRSG